MSKTDYAGIDYGLGKTNVDKETGIRYAVISQNSLDGEAVSDVYHNGRDLTHEAYIQAVKDALRGVLSDYFSDYKHDGKVSKLDSAVAIDAFDAVADGVGDNYMPDSVDVLYEKDGYTVGNCLANDFMVTRSPYYADFHSSAHLAFREPATWIRRVMMG